MVGDQFAIDLGDDIDVGRFDVIGRNSAVVFVHDEWKRAIQKVA